MQGESFVVKRAFPLKTTYTCFHIFLLTAYVLYEMFVYIDWGVSHRLTVMTQPTSDYQISMIANDYYQLD